MDRRVAGGNLTRPPPQIQDVNLSVHPARAAQLSGRGAVLPVREQAGRHRPADLVLFSGQDAFGSLIKQGPALALVAVDLVRAGGDGPAEEDVTFGLHQVL